MATTSFHKAGGTVHTSFSTHSTSEPCEPLININININTDITDTPDQLRHTPSTLPYIW